MPFVKAGGLTNHYAEEGPAGAPAVLLLHSLGTDHQVWDELAAALARRFRVVRPDLRGHGLTDCPPGPYAMDAFAGDALSLLDAVGAARAHVVGLSLGGMVAQVLAARAPERVERLVLCATGPRIGTVAVWNERIEGASRRGMASIADGVLARWFTSRLAGERPADHAGWANRLLRTPAEGYAASCAAIRDADLTRQAAAIRAPTLVIAGAEDQVVPVAAARALAETIPGAELAVVDEAAHLPVIERGAATLALIEGFLGRASGAAEGDALERGLAVRTAVLGAAHVQRARGSATEFDRDFQDFITRCAWGGAWTRGVLDRRTRSLLTIAILAALGHHEELKLHVRATANTGASRDDVKEALIHTAVYAGVPAANSAFRHAREVYQELDKEKRP